MESSVEPFRKRLSTMVIDGRTVRAGLPPDATPQIYP